MSNVIKIGRIVKMPERKPITDYDEKTKWTLSVRKSGLIEWTCVHGIGHPDKLSMKRLDAFPDYEGSKGTWGIHGCDGCCEKDTFPGRVTKKFEVWVTERNQGLLIKDISDNHLINIKGHLIDRLDETYEDVDEERFLTKWQKRINKEIAKRGLHDKK